jgi:16S rRNA (uracil1498-N3)-methyltransferase
MTRRRFIADAVDGDRATLLGSHAAHLSRVLRARPGQVFEITAEGRVRRGRILTAAADRVEFELGEDVPAAALIPVTMYLAIIKFDRLEWMIEKCTELGATRIVPLIAARTDSHLAAAGEKRIERWRRLALQAGEQSRRAEPPEISFPERLTQKILAVQGTRVVLVESEYRVTLKEALAGTLLAGLAGDSGLPSQQPNPRLVDGVALAVGPEGGWTEGELKWFCAARWTSASLGPMILRTETAAIAALAIVRSELLAQKV